MIPKLVINKNSKLAEQPSKEEILSKDAKIISQLTERLKLQGEALREKVEELKSNF